MRSLWISDKFNLARYDSLQPHHNLAHRAEFERETAEVCQAYGIGVIPYSPLAGGFLTGKYRKGESIPESMRADGTKRRYFNDHGWGVLTAAEEIATEKGKSVSQIALAWLLSNELITSPIIGPRTLRQLDDNLGAAGLRLCEEEKQELDAASDWKSA
jgi:aryl-alcohol dehydrogenase-like predicted oxidoreductase